MPGSRRDSYPTGWGSYLSRAYKDADSKPVFDTKVKVQGPVPQSGDRHVGVRVVVLVNGRDVLGTIEYIGKPKFAEGLWIGVRLDESLGKNDGSVQGVQYFQCLSKHGIFVRKDSSKIKVIPDDPPLAAGQVDWLGSTPRESSALAPSQSLRSFADRSLHSSDDCNVLAEKANRPHRGKNRDSIIQSEFAALQRCRAEADMEARNKLVLATVANDHLTRLRKELEWEIDVLRSELLNSNREGRHSVESVEAQLLAVQNQLELSLIGHSDSEQQCHLAQDESKTLENMIHTMRKSHARQEDAATTALNLARREHEEATMRHVECHESEVGNLEREAKAAYDNLRHEYDTEMAHNRARRESNLSREKFMKSEAATFLQERDSAEGALHREKSLESQARNLLHEREQTEEHLRQQINIEAAQRDARREAVLMHENSLQDDIRKFTEERNTAEDSWRSEYAREAALCRARQETEDATMRQKILFEEEARQFLQEMKRAEDTWRQQSELQAAQSDARHETALLHEKSLQNDIRKCSEETKIAEDSWRSEYAREEALCRARMETEEATIRKGLEEKRIADDCWRSEYAREAAVCRARQETEHVTMRQEILFEGEARQFLREKKMAEDHWKQECELQAAQSDAQRAEFLLREKSLQNDIRNYLEEKKIAEDTWRNEYAREAALCRARLETEEATARKDSEERKTMEDCWRTEYAQELALCRSRLETEEATTRESLEEMKNSEDSWRSEYAREAAVCRASLQAENATMGLEILVAENAQTLLMKQKVMEATLQHEESLESESRRLLGETEKAKDQLSKEYEIEVSLSRARQEGSLEYENHLESQLREVLQQKEAVDKAFRLEASREGGLRTLAEAAEAAEEIIKEEYDDEARQNKALRVREETVVRYEISLEVETQTLLQEEKEMEVAHAKSLESSAQAARAAEDYWRQKYEDELARNKEMQEENVDEGSESVAANETPKRPKIRPPTAEEDITCPSCGENSPIASRFCQTCGDSLQDLVPCINADCGKSLVAGSTFCPHCGESQKSSTLCVNSECKQPLDSGTSFCHVCGSPQ
eukprot:TRINITY_DN5248_c0_g1_i1.p1 TRINITY_DN5248_c0_g1~~TRINITY_DN5248_c0_g1_i1.p1  ORF type:complete len:1066 (+),score=225.86 TRINITY_DN5248_c0_g1_i1:284-3481(+)